MRTSHHPHHWLLAVLLAACTTSEPDMMTEECDEQALESLPDGHHNEGRACLTGGCHDGGTPQAPPWTIAGTLYRSSGGTTPLAGGTIELVDAAGTAITLVSAQNGNFYTTQQVTFPLTAEASSCLETRQMPSPVPAGSCNQGGCHDTRRINLP